MNQQKLLTLFEYDRENGTLISKVDCNRRPRGVVIGSENDRGYLVCKIEGKIYKVHRLIWLAEYGHLPEKQLDHIDGDRKNNHISNLRQVTDTENQQNRKNVKGYYRTKDGKYRVDLYFGGVPMYVGTYLTEQEAKDAYIEAKIQHYPGYKHTGVSSKPTVVESA